MKKHFYRSVLSCLLLLIAQYSFAQDLKTLKATSKEKDLPVAYYQIAKLYADSTASHFNLDSAFFYIQEVDKAMKNLSDKEKTNAREEMKPTALSVRKDITKKALAQASKVNTLAAYDHFLDFYKKADAADRTQAEKWRNELVLKNVTDQSSYADLTAVYQKYGASLQSKNAPAYAKLEQQLFDTFLKEKGWSNYDDFATAHPQHIFVGNGTKEQYQQMLATPNPVVVERFIAKYPGTAFERIGTDSLAAKVLRSSDLAAAERFVTRYKTHPQANSVWASLYENYKKQFPNQADLQRFKEKYPTFPFPERIANDVKNASDGSYLAAMKSSDPLVSRQFLKLNPTHPKRDSVWLHFFEIELQKNPGVAGVERFERDYADFPFPQRIEKAKVTALQNEYKQVMQSKDKDRAMAFLTKNPTYAKKDSVWLHFFNLYQAQVKSVAEWETFQQQYPNFPFPDRVKSAIAKTKQAQEADEFERLKTAQEVSAFLQFVETYPNSSRKSEVLKMLDNVVVNSKKIEEVESYLEKYPKTANRKVLLANLYELYKAQQGLAGIEAFEAKYTGAIAPTIIEADREELQTKRSYIPVALSNNVNSRFQEHLPVLSADGNTLYFCGVGRSDNLSSLEDIFVSRKVNGEWTKAELVKELSTSSHHEAPLSLSIDGNDLIFFIDGKMYTSRKTTNGWGKGVELPATINRDAWQADPHISADGKAMFFSSGSSNTTNTDLYVSVMQPNGTWGNAINLGATINTSASERSPFLHPDMKTLYFSSTGHNTKGGLDIYKSIRLDSTAWTKWSTPVNLGDTINSSLSEWGFKVATDGQTAYFSKGSSYEDIYMVQLTKAQQPGRVTIIQGKVIDNKNNPIETNIIWQNLESGDTIQVTRSSPTGSFFATLPPMRGLIGYSVSKKGFFPVTGNVDLREGSGKTLSRRDSVIIVLSSIETAKQEGITLPLNNLFFETAKYEILPESFVELDRWAEIIQTNNLKVEIHGHTDNVGNAGNNQTLSQNRANSVRTYLISKGCKENQLTATGFGETKPVANNDGEEGRSKNRRVEIKIKS